MNEGVRPQKVRSSSLKKQYAFDEVFEILNDHKGDSLYGVFHCFSGTYQQALQAIELNFMLGIGGVVTFKNGQIDHPSVFSDALIQSVQII